MNETIIGGHRRNLAKQGKPARFKRTTYVVDRVQQLRFVRQFAILGVIAILLCTANLYVVFELAPHYPVAMDGEPVSLLGRSVYWLYGTATLVMSIAIFFSVALFFSHRVVGPEVKIANALRRFANRETDINIVLRQSDYLGEVASAVNCAAAAWQDSVKDVNAAIALLRRHPEITDSPELQAIVRAIEAAVEPEPSSEQ